MFKINKITSNPTVDFAAEELKKYLWMMMPEGGDVKIAYNPEAKDGFRLGLMQDFGLDVSDAEEPDLDDILYIDCDTLPSFGLDEPAHLATAVAYIINDMAFNGERTEKELAEVVQWALANHIMVDSYATDVYASLRGVTVTGDFTDADAEVITEITPDLKGNSLYIVTVGDTDIDMDEEEVDGRLDAFMAKLGTEIETLTEKDFYEKLADMEEVDKEAGLFLMDYFTQENFGVIYAENAVEGMGSPSVETTKEIEKESVGGAVKWHCKTKAPNWMVLCCVCEEAKPAFETAMKKLYGEDCLEKLNVARKGASRVID